MLQKLNERIQGVIAWIVIVLIAITFTLFGVDYYMQSHQTSNAIADVNGEPISKQIFEINYRRARQQRDPSKITAETEQALKQQVLKDMITNEASVQAAKSAGFNVNSTQADAAILSIPQFQEEGHFSPERYQQALSGAMFTHDSFRNEVMQGMLLNQQRFAFIGSAFALPGEIKRFVKLYMQARDYEYLEIPTALFMKEKQITEQAINEYYQSHQKEFLTPEKVSIDYIRLSMQQIKDKTIISADEISRYYNDNQSSFQAPAQWQVAHILFAVPADASAETQNQIKQKADDAYDALQKNPALFDEWVKTKSDDKLSIANGGILPWLVAGQSGYDKELASLTTAGQISTPAKSSHGYEIFKLIAYKPAILKPLSAVEKDIKEQLSADLAQKHYTHALEQLGDLSYQSPDSLTPVSDAVKLPVEQTELFSRQGGDTNLTKNKQIISTAFSNDVLELNNNSEPIQLDNDSVLVLRVNKRVPAAEKPLTEVKEYIRKKLSLLNAEKEAKQLGMKFLAAETDPALEEKIIKENKLQWHQVEKAPRDTDKVDAAINDLAFNLPKANKMEGRRLASGDYVIVRLKKIINGQVKALDKEQQANLAQQIEASNGVMDYDLYVNELLKKAKIDKY